MSRTVVRGQFGLAFGQEVSDRLHIGVRGCDGHVRGRLVGSLGGRDHLDGCSDVLLQERGEGIAGGIAGGIAMERLDGIVDVDLVLHQPRRDGIEGRRVGGEGRHRGYVHSMCRVHSSRIALSSAGPLAVATIWAGCAWEAPGALGAAPRPNTGAAVDEKATSVATMLARARRRAAALGSVAVASDAGTSCSMTSTGRRRPTVPFVTRPAHRMRPQASAFPRHQFAHLF